MRRVLAQVGVIGALLLAHLFAAGCGKVHEVTLELRTATQAADDLGMDTEMRASFAALDCGAGYARPLAAVCLQTYTLRDEKIAMDATCHDAPNIATEEDLVAFLRGKSPLVEGLVLEDGTTVFVRLLGYESATRQSSALVMCGITPSLPGHLEGSASEASLPMYLLCDDVSGEPSVARTLFDDYCSSPYFVALFP